MIFKSFILHLLLLSTPCSLVPRIAPSYTRAFVKYLIAKYDSSGVAAIDEFYEVLINNIGNSQGEPPGHFSTFSYKSYLLPLCPNYLKADFVSSSFDDNCAIVLKERLELISEGTTGLQTWDAALTLSEWLLLHSSPSNDTVSTHGVNINCEIQHNTNDDIVSFFPVSLHSTIDLNIFRGRRILELGSGTGLVGILLCKLLSPEIVYLSDIHPTVLSLLMENISLNKTPCAHVLSLDWEGYSTQNLLDLNVDVIFGADIVYDVEVIPHLVRVLEVLLRREEISSTISDPFYNPFDTTKSAKSCMLSEPSVEPSLKPSEEAGVFVPRPVSSQRVAFISSTVRNEITTGVFLVALADRGFTVQVWYRSYSVN